MADVSSALRTPTAPLANRPGAPTATPTPTPVAATPTPTPAPTIGQDVRAAAAPVVVAPATPLEAAQADIAAIQARMPQATTPAQRNADLAALRAAETKAYEANPEAFGVARPRAIAHTEKDHFWSSARTVWTTPPLPPIPQSARAASNAMAPQVQAANMINLAHAQLTGGSPTQAAATTASLLSRPGQLTDAVAALKQFEGTPLGDQLQAQTQAITERATAANLATQLQADPDLAHYPPGTAGDLVRLRLLNDPQLKEPIAGVARNALANAHMGKNNPLLAGALSNPDGRATAQLLAPFANPDAPEQGQMADLVRDAARQNLRNRLNAAQGEAGVNAALEGFRADMVAMARAGVSPDLVASISQEEAGSRGAKDLATERVRAGQNIFQNAYDWITDFAAEVGSSIRDLAGEAAGALRAEVNHQLDETVLGPSIGRFESRSAGMMGELLTNRLEVGESIGIALDASGRIGPVSLGGNAQMHLTRVQARDPATGAPLPDVDGVPQTRIQVRLAVEARAGAELEASFRKSSEVDGKGASATATVNVGAMASGRAELTLEFDATSEADMGELRSMFGEAAAAGLKATIPGVGPLLARESASEVVDIAKSHAHSLRLEAGVRVNAEGAIQVSAGGGQERSGNTVAVGDHELTKPQAELTDEEKARRAANGDVPQVSAGVNAGASFEAYLVFRTDYKANTTSEGIIIRTEAQASASATATGADPLTAGVGGATDREVLATRNAAGQLIDVSITDRHTRESFLGLGRLDIQGQLDTDAVARIAESDGVTVVRHLTNPGAMEGRNVMAMYREAGRLAETPNNPALRPGRIFSTHNNTVTVGKKFFGIGLTLSLIHAQETELNRR